MVSLVDRARARARYVSFRSNHDSGTALPPPSVSGFRGRSPVTCGFSLSRLARSRRPCAVGGAARPLDARELAQPLETATCRSRGCSVRAAPHLLRSPRGPVAVDIGRHRISVRQAVSPPIPAISLDAGVWAPSATSSPGIASPPSSPSSPLMRARVRGSGAPASLAGCPSPCARRCDPRGIATCRHPAGSSEPVFATVAGHLANQCRDAAISPIQRHGLVPKRGGPEGGGAVEFSGSPGHAAGERDEGFPRPGELSRNRLVLRRFKLHSRRGAGRRLRFSLGVGGRHHLSFASISLRGARPLGRSLAGSLGGPPEDCPRNVLPSEGLGFSDAGWVLLLRRDGEQVHDDPTHAQRAWDVLDSLWSLPAAQWPRR